MPEIPINEAAIRLRDAVARLNADGIKAVYDEMFPEEDLPREGGAPSVNAAADRIRDHMAAGLQIEEILDLWSVVFPRDTKVHYDEDSKTIRCNEETATYVD